MDTHVQDWSAPMFLCLRFPLDRKMPFVLDPVAKLSWVSWLKPLTLLALMAFRFLYDNDDDSLVALPAYSLPALYRLQGETLRLSIYCGEEKLGRPSTLFDFDLSDDASGCL